MFRLSDADSWGKEVGNYFTSRGVRTWRVRFQIITIAASRSVPYMLYLAHVATGVCVAGEVGIGPYVYYFCLAHQDHFLSERRSNH